MTQNQSLPYTFIDSEGNKLLAYAPSMVVLTVFADNWHQSCIRVKTNGSSYFYDAYDLVNWQANFLEAGRWFADHMLTLDLGSGLPS